MDSFIYGPFMELLRAGLWNKKPNIYFFALSSYSWKSIKKEGQKQTVSGILYDGILLLPEKYHPPLDILFTWAAEVEFLERANHSVNHVTASLYSSFTKQGITLSLQKGQGLAALYNEPLHRVCGDIDWYIPTPLDRKKAEVFLLDKKIEVENQAGFSQIYKYDGVEVEHHSRLLDSHNPFVRKYLKKIEARELSKGMKLSLHGEEISLASPLLCHLQVNMHILKHMLSFGIGLRQLCDAARICYSLHEKIDGSELEKIYRKTGIYRWVLVLNELLVLELGLDEAYLPFSRSQGISYNWMIQEVWASGNFGFHDQRYGGFNHATGHRRYIHMHWFHRFRLHLRLAPQETLWFPITHFLSGFNSSNKNNNRIIKAINGFYKYVSKRFQVIFGQRH